MFSIFTERLYTFLCAWRNFSKIYLNSVQSSSFSHNVFQVIFYSTYLFIYNAPVQLYLFLCLNLPAFNMLFILVVRIYNMADFSHVILKLSWLSVCYLRRWRPISEIRHLLLTMLSAQKKLNNFPTAPSNLLYNDVIISSTYCTCRNNRI